MTTHSIRVSAAALQHLRARATRERRTLAATLDIILGVDAPLVSTGKGTPRSTPPSGAASTTRPKGVGEHEWALRQLRERRAAERARA